MDECKECACASGMSHHNWMSHDEYRIVRGIMMFFLILFVFVAGLALGELKAYLRQQDGYGANWGSMSPGSMMRSGYNGMMYYNNANPFVPPAQ